MINVNEHSCCGCKACADICPKVCITFRMSQEGFFYPVVDETNCINCNLCERVCPVNNFPGTNQEKRNAYYGIYENVEVVEKSSSGGAFTAIYEVLLKNGYIVYGVAWENHLQVAYSRASTRIECESFRKSKYLLADTKQLFSKVHRDLLDGQKVLVSGSPCVCSALVNYLQIKRVQTDNLLLVDIICHGAGSQKVFDDYVAEQEKIYGRIKSINFKHKPYDLIQQEDFGKTKKFLQIIFWDGNQVVRAVEDDPFLVSYYQRLHYRPYCGECTFARPERVTDITLGDAWGIGKIDNAYDPLKGVSLILVHTDKGQAVVDEISDVMGLKSISYEWAITANEQLQKPTVIHKNRDRFYGLLPRYGFSTAVKKTTKPSIKMQTHIFIMRMTPKFIKTALKRLIRK